MFQGLLIEKVYLVQSKSAEQTAIAIPVSGILFARCGVNFATRMILNAYERGLISEFEII